MLRISMPEFSYAFITSLSCETSKILLQLSTPVIVNLRGKLERDSETILTRSEFLQRIRQEKRQVDVGGCQMRP